MQMVHGMGRPAKQQRRAHVCALNGLGLLSVLLLNHPAGNVDLQQLQERSRASICPPLQLTRAKMSKVVTCIA